MSRHQVILVIAVGLLVLIASGLVGAVIRSRRRFIARHAELIVAWNAAAARLGLDWVVPREVVLREAGPPALHGRVEGRPVYVALRDDKADEDLLPKWVVDVHVGCGVRGKPDRAVLRALRRGRRAEAKVIGAELRVQRAGLLDDADALVAYAREVVAAAAALEARA